MAEALEWIQCKKCGRRHRWTAELAGRTFPCRCGTSIVCPDGPAVTSAGTMSGTRLPPDASFSDTIVESVDSPTARSPELGTIDAFQTQMMDEFASVRTIEDIKSTNKFFIWGGLFLVGLSLLIHAVITQWPIYIGLTVVFTPLFFWKFYKAKKRWQKGRPFWQTLMRSLGMEG